jgi:hypothetical protein
VQNALDPQDKLVIRPTVAAAAAATKAPLAAALQRLCLLRLLLRACTPAAKRRCRLKCCEKAAQARVDILRNRPWGGIIPMLLMLLPLLLVLLLLLLHLCLVPLYCLLHSSCPGTSCVSFHC